MPCALIPNIRQAREIQPLVEDGPQPRQRAAIQDVYGLDTAELLDH
jgi:hypothetical protein